MHVSFPEINKCRPRSLDELESDQAEAKAGKILFGLGFDKAMQVRINGPSVLLFFSYSLYLVL
jgi:hypothetical protein